LRIVFDPVRNWLLSIRSNEELMDLCTEPDITSQIRKWRILWLGHVARMPEERAIKNIPERKGYVANN